MFVFCMVFFFFKQKTAYEMRISDWSSDVCSSDLTDQGGERARRAYRRPPVPHRRADLDPYIDQPHPRRPDRAALRSARSLSARPRRRPASRRRKDRGVAAKRVRSEEHTSELQSLMRISYAVFCLKKKK